MDTVISSDNPYGYNRYGWAWELVPGSSRCHLDYGCEDGRLTEKYRQKGVERVFGVDASRPVIANAKENFPLIDFRHLVAGERLPFDDGMFTSITLLAVLEHVDKQVELLTELARVLDPKGVLLIMVPKQHIFSFLDMGNLKFRFPRLHRRYYLMRHSEEEYEYRYVNNPDGLIGDISATKRWHEHFTQKKLSDLLEAAGLRAAGFDGCGLFTRTLEPFLHTVGRIPPIGRIINFARRLDARLFKSESLFCVADCAAD